MCICDDVPFLLDYVLVEGTDMKVTPLIQEQFGRDGFSGVGTGHGPPSGNNL